MVDIVCVHAVTDKPRVFGLQLLSHAWMFFAREPLRDVGQNQQCLDSAGRPAAPD